jgi:hypothetical protein
LAKSTRVQYWRNRTRDRDNKVLAAKSVLGQKYSLNWYSERGPAHQ